MAVDSMQYAMIREVLEIIINEISWQTKKKCATSIVPFNFFLSTSLNNCDAGSAYMEISAIEC